MRINMIIRVLAVVSSLLILITMVIVTASSQNQPSLLITPSNRSGGDYASFTPVNTPSASLSLLYSNKGSNDDTYQLYSVSLNALSSPTAIPGNPLLNPFIASENRVAWSPKTGSFLIASDDGKLYVLAAGQTVPTPFKTSTIAGTTYNDAQWAPDGQGVVFILEVDNMAVPTYTQYLAVFTPDGTLHQLAGPYISSLGQGMAISGPQWSPDGDYIAFSLSSATGSLSSSVLQIITTNCLSNPSAVCQLSSLSPTNTPNYTPVPPASVTLVPTSEYNPGPPTNIGEAWFSPSWLSDSKHLLFGCSANDILNFCIVNRDGTDFKRLFTVAYSGSLLYTVSPDRRLVAYQDDAGIRIYDFAAGRDIGIVALDALRIGMMVWVSQQSTQLLIQLPTLAPSPTASLKLSLKPICITLPKNIWTWAIVNPNIENVSFHIEMYDSQTNSIEISQNGNIDAASNGIPQMIPASIDTDSTSLRVRLFVNGILQDDQATPPLPCHRTP